MAKGNDNNNLYSTNNQCIRDDHPHHSSLSSDHPSLFKLSSNSSLRNESLHSICISSQEFTSTSTTTKDNNHNPQQQQHRASDLSSVGQKVRMQQLLNAPQAEAETETDPSKKASPNDTRSTNATTAYNDSHQNKNHGDESLGTLQPSPKNNNDDENDEILKRLGAASDSSEDDDDLSRPMSFVSSLSSAASASGAHLILPDRYADYQLKPHIQPDKEHLWDDEERQRHDIAVDDNSAPSSLDAWTLFHLVLRGESRDVVDCAHALKHGPPKRRKQQGVSQTPTPPPSNSNSSTIQPWQLSALRDLLDRHVQTLQTYHQLYQTVLLPALAQRFRLPTKPNEHDVEHRELLRRIKQARDESLAPLLERLEVVADDLDQKDDTSSQNSEEDASFSNISTASLLSSLLAQLQAYKARLERHLRSQEDTTLTLMRTYCTPQHMQRLRLTRIWLAPTFGQSSGLLWGGLVHRVGLATFRMTVLEEQEHVPRAVWYVRFKPAWKMYVRDFVQVVHALKTGVRPLSSKSSSSKSSSASSSSSVASLSILSTSVVPATVSSEVEDKDDEEPTDKVNGSNDDINGAAATTTANSTRGGVLLRSWKRSSSHKDGDEKDDKGAANDTTTKSSASSAVPTRTAQVLRSWRRDNGSGGAIRSSSSLFRPGVGAGKVVQC